LVKRLRCSSREGARVLAAVMASMRPFETKRIIKAEGGICEAVAGNVARADDGAGIGCLHRGRSAGSASCTTTSGLLESAARTRPPRRAETGQRRQPEEHVPDLPSMCFRIWSGRVRERSSNRFLSPASAGLESLHLLCSDQGPNHSVHPSDRAPMLSEGHMGELDPAGNDEHTDGSCPRGHCRLWR